jgi:hypothetical protein
VRVLALPFHVAWPDLSSYMRCIQIGPVLAFGVPPVRKSMGWKPAERIPTNFPGEWGHRTVGSMLEGVAETFSKESTRRVETGTSPPNELPLGRFHAANSRYWSR